MREMIKKLFASDESTNSIAKNSGVSYSVVQRLRTGERPLDRVELLTAEKLYDYALKKESGANETER